MNKHRLPLYVPVLALTAIAVFFVGIATEIFGEEMKIWLLTRFNANPPLFLGVTVVVLLLLIPGAIWVIQQQQPTAPPADMPAVTDTRVNPRAYLQLPDDLANDPDARGFIIAARQQEYAELKAQLLRPPQQTRWQALCYRLSFRRLCRPIHVPVAIITGIGGIGKTALGRRVCYEREIKSEYHHGRFYFDAAGIYPQFADNSTAQVLYRFLSRSDVSPEALSHTLGSPPPASEQVPAWLESRKYDVDITSNLCSLYRQTLEGRKRLIILDNPPDTMEVRAFEPPAGNALLVITRPGLSRHTFSGVKSLTLGKFDDQAAQQLLERAWPGEGARLVTRINRLSSGIPLVLIVLARTLKYAAETGGLTAAEMLLTELEQEHRKGGWLGARFLSRLLRYSGEPHRETITDVFGLSYQRLTATAQGIFRALAIFSGYDFRAEAATAVGAGDETGFAQLVNRGLVESELSQETRRYFLYDPIAEYARTLLHANADEVRVVKERYVDYFIAYVTDQERSLATIEPGEEATVLVAALRRDLVHLQVCRAMLNDTAPDDLPTTVRRLRLALPTLAIINRAIADDQSDQSWFPAGTAGEWEDTARAALEQIWAELDEAARMVFAGVGIFPGPFDLHAASVILAPVLPTIDQQRLERLVAHGLLQQPAAEQYEICWPLLQQRARQSFAALPTAEQQTLRQSFARYYAQRAADFYVEAEFTARQTLFAWHWPALAQGQVFAASATPPLDTELITYAGNCFWYLDQQRSYDTLTDWLETALAAAQRTDDLPALARLSVDRGIVAERQGQWDTARDWYQRALDTPGADPATRASACYGLGFVAQEQQQWDTARDWYQRALDTPGADPATRATACQGLGFVARQQQQWNIAQQWYQRVLDTPGADPATRARACIGLGVVAREQQQWDTARDWYQRAFDTPGADPDTRANAAHNLGVVAREQQQWDTARDWYQRALDTPGADPDTRANACIGLGIVTYKQADYMAARDHYTRAIALDPGLAAAYRNRGLAWANGDDHDYRQALADAHLALLLDPHFQAAREDIERYQHKLDQQPENNTDWLEIARESVQRLQELSAIACLCLDRGIVAERQQQWETARDYYQRALDIPGVPSDICARACHGLGVVASTQAEYVAARDYYTRAIALDPGLAAAYRNRGLAWTKGDDHDYRQALADARRALELDQNFQAAREDIERYQQALEQQSGDSQSDM
jgi:tetratricopeptide (TPR) repeat protein